MSEITTRIKAFKDTNDGWDSLKEWLATKRYPIPVRYIQARDESDDLVSYQEGTWDEVRRCRNMGLISNDQYMEIVGAADKKRTVGRKKEFASIMKTNY